MRVKRENEEWTRHSAWLVYVLEHNHMRSTGVDCPNATLISGYGWMHFACDSPLRPLWQSARLRSSAVQYDDFY